MSQKCNLNKTLAANKRHNIDLSIVGNLNILNDWGLSEEMFTLLNILNQPVFLVILSSPQFK